MNSLNGKVAVVTGGASGIGLAAARMFVRCGARVVIGDIADGREAADEIGGFYQRCDVTEPESVENLVRTAVSHHGKLDVYFSNAGIVFQGPLAAADPAEHRRSVDVNVNGVFYGLQSAVRVMLANPGPTRGSIVTTASVAGLVGCPGLASYNATKGAVVLLTKNAALEYAEFGIRVNAVCPGIVRTPMTQRLVDAAGEFLRPGELERAHPLGRIAEPEEVAKLVTFLASDDSSFITGTAIPIDGGMTAGFRARSLEF